MGVLLNSRFSSLIGKTDITHVSVVLLAVGIGVSAGGLLYLFYLKGEQLKEEAFGERIKASIEDSFRRNDAFSYQKLQKWLKAIGAEYTVKGFGDPFRFVVTNLFLMLGVLFLFGLLGKFGAGVFVALLAVLTEVVMLLLIDQRKNREMLSDISFLYDATAIQLSSHIYVVQAVANCLEYIKSKRLKQALAELCGNIAVGGDIRAAIRDFCEKFHNDYLDTYGNVILQIATETGEAVNLMEDMSRQLKALKEASFLTRKKGTENKLQLCIIGIFLLFTLLIFFLCIAGMTGSTGMLF